MSEIEISSVGSSVGMGLDVFAEVWVFARNNIKDLIMAEPDFIRCPRYRHFLSFKQKRKTATGQKTTNSFGCNIREMNRFDKAETIGVVASHIGTFKNV